MGRQFSKVSGAYGAPMGRRSSPLALAPRSIRLFKVRINSGGYDDGGAYWGIGKPLWCARDVEGDCQFTRAATRKEAAEILGIESGDLMRGFNHETR